MMTEPTPETPRERLERLRAELESDLMLTSDERIRIRDEILGLFREVEAQIAELEEVKEGVRPLVERYRELYSRPEPPRAPARVDYLGSSTYRERGWSALAAADYERALRDLEKAIELDPESPSNLALLAWTYLRLDEPRKAQLLLDEVLARDATHRTGRMCMGFLKLHLREYDRALHYLGPIACDGTDQTASMYANLYLGMVHVEQGMYLEAQTFFRRALELGPNLTEAHWEMGRSHQREGRDDLALEAWKAGAENRFNPWGERCREAVAHLEARGASPFRFA
jgi:tetratricopeptide (TPR) repeat protein